MQFKISTSTIQTNNQHLVNKHIPTNRCILSNICPKKNKANSETVKRKWFHCWIFSIAHTNTNISHLNFTTQASRLQNIPYSLAHTRHNHIILCDETQNKKIIKKTQIYLLHTRNENKISKTENRIASAQTALHTHFLFEGIATDDVVVNILI